MSISKEAKTKIIKDFQRATGDTGSSEVQVALLTAEINILSEHSKKHPNDIHCRGGILMKVMLRKSLLAYLKRTRFEDYKNLIKKLGLRH